MKFNYTDTRSFINGLTFNKMRNMYQLYRSFNRSFATQKAEIRGLPMTISIEPTTACNLRCPECPSGLRSFTRPTGNMNKDFFSKLIQENYAHLSYLIFYFQGEPYINPDFLEMVDFASRHKIYTLSSTNGHFLDEEIAKKTIESGLNRLIISIDGVTQTSYESYRKEGSLQQVLDNTKRLVELKRRMRSRTPHIVFQFLVVKPNQYEVPEMKKLADSIGVDELKFKTAQIYDYQHGNPLIPTIEKYSRYRKLDDKTYVLKNKLYNKCWKMWHSCVITWDGKVVPCCFDKDARYVMGDLNKNSLASIWNSQTYKRFRQDILNDRKQIDICTNCTEGNAVWTSD